MLIYLDSNVVIYLIEQSPIWGTKATNRIAAASALMSQLVVSDLTRLECKVKPIALADAALLRKYEIFFVAPDVHVVNLTAQICDRAAEIRAHHRFKLGDALNLAAAVEVHCDIFLTNDGRLSRFPDITVEVLP